MRAPTLPFDRSRLLDKKPKKERGLAGKILLGIGVFILTFYVLVALLVVGLRFLNPPLTMVQVQRQVSAIRAHKKYNVYCAYVPLSRMTPDLQYAVIAAEDGRFYVHHGFDWVELQKVVQSDMAKKKLGRGASTITQQLVKNLFLGTERSVIRKGIEFTIVPIVELLLTKDRILELYLNVIEWGPGVFGAEAASEHWYGKGATLLTREQCARLASIIPNPLRRTPEMETEYADEILVRMKQMGW